MGSPVIIPTTIDAVNVADVNGIFLQWPGGVGLPGSLVTTRGSDDVAPGQEGRFARNRIGDFLRLELAGHVRGDGADEEADQADYWDNRLTLGTLLDPRNIVEVGVTLPNGNAYTINARPMDLSYDEQVPSFAYCAVVLESIDPDWVPVGS